MIQPLNIFHTLDRAVDSAILISHDRPTHILLGQQEYAVLAQAMEILGATLATGAQPFMHRGLHVYKVEIPSLIQVGTLCAPMEDHT
jgi:hypothetical protein